jgi:hypothetical protein
MTMTTPALAEPSPELLGELARRAGRPDFARFVAKYATKSTEQAGGLLHRVKASDVDSVRVRPHVRAHLHAAFELHEQAEPHADAVRRAHAAAAAAEAHRYPPAASGQHPNELAHRAHQAIARDERVRIRVRGERRDRCTRIAACGDAEPRNGIALALTLRTGERVHLADVALIAHATPKLRDRHDPRLAACAHQFGHRGHCLTKSRRYSTTFTALRQARHDHAVRQHDARGADGGDGQLALGADRVPTRIVSLRYAGQGHFTAADELLAASAEARAREQRRAAREARSIEVNTGGAG